MESLIIFLRAGDFMYIFELPENYRQTMRIDLKHDKKKAIWLNTAALFIEIILLVVGYVLVPVDIYKFFSQELYISLIKLFILLALVVVYMMLHEAVHGIFFKKFSGKKVKYGFTGLYAYAKSDAFFNKKEYLIIGLAPVVFFGILCLILNLILRETLFWYIYIVQIANLSGATGDFYVSFILRKKPDDILIYDEGTAMNVFEKIN